MKFSLLCINYVLEWERADIVGFIEYISSLLDALQILQGSSIPFLGVKISSKCRYTL